MPRLLALLCVLPLLAGFAGGAAAQNTPAQDKGTASVFDDENIETDALARITGANAGKVHVTVTSFNRRLLLTGEVPNAAARAEIEKLVSGVPKVRAISNELVVGEISGVSSRTADSWITSDLKRRLRGSPEVSADQIKVVAENHTVFLMGRVRHREAAAAAEIASTTNRVERVVLVFDYLD